MRNVDLLIVEVKLDEYVKCLFSMWRKVKRL